jgi:hypothetical protein
MIKFIKNLFKGRKQQCNIPVVSHSTSKNEDVSYKKDKAWRDPYCQICETATGKVLKDYGVTVHRT